jgi:anti-anti-sigma factor
MSNDSEWIIAIDSNGRAARLCGEFDLTNSAIVADALAAMPDPQAQVVVDVGAVTFCSAALIGCLIASAHRFAGLGSHLALSPLSAPMRHLLELTDTTDLFLVE